MAQDTGKFRENVLDKFYTRPAIAAAAVGRILEVIPGVEGWQWIEPSAGGGAFLQALPPDIRARAIAIDLAPTAPGILTGNFLQWAPPAGATSRIVFGNPPFGRQGSLAKQFIAASAWADAIAFILPRSFLKPSMSRAFPATFHLEWSQELAADSFEVNGQPHAVPTVFQIWRKRTGPRAAVAEATPAGFSFVRPGDPFTLSVRRVGVNAGRAFPAEKEVSPQSHYFVRLDDESRRDVVLEGLSGYPFPSNTTGPRSLSRGEIAAVLNGLVGAGPM